MRRHRLEAAPWLDASAPIIGGIVAGAVAALGAALPVAAMAGVAAWLARVGSVFARGPRRDRPAPWRLVEPLARRVDHAIDSADAYRSIARSLDPGPLRDRLVDEVPVVDHSVIAVWQAALASAELARFAAAAAPQDRTPLLAQLQALEDRLDTLGANLRDVVADTSAIAISQSAHDGSAVLAERISALRDADREIGELVGRSSTA